MVAMSVAMPIIGWFASALIGKLADKVRSYIGDQYVYQSTSDKDILKGLERNLCEIQASLHKADPNEIRNPALEKWISDLQHASYDAEDVFDKFEYKLLKDQVRGKNQVCNNLASSSRNLSKRAQTFIKQILFLDGDLNELLTIAGRFADLVKDMGIFIQLVDAEREFVTNQCEKMEWRQTTSTLTESLVLGRELAIAHVREFLQEVEGDDGRPRKQNVSVLPIVGIGGVGKTTIAQYVYNDQTMTSHFDLKAWVCVSDRFEVEWLMKEIIESASLETPPDFHYLQNLDRIEKTLQKGLKQKKFLLVLDDVWNEKNMPKWEMLKNTLKLGKEGSKVIVTTRDHKVADRMKTTNSVLLEGLEYEDSWKLFVQYAFYDENPEDHLKLKSIGRQITRRLGGLPLAAKTIGGMLKFELGEDSEDFWRGILESKLWDGDHAGDIMTVLKLSYECLPAHLKQCFIYSSLFPKDYRFNKDALVRIWVAHGFIQPSRDKIKTMEELGRAYIDELVSRSLFEGKASDGHFVIHDLLHDLAVSLSSNEYFRVENFESDEEPEEIPERVRHLYIRAETLATFGDNKYSYASKNLRSLVVSGPSDFELSRETLKELTGLRVLIFENLHLKWSPESISELIHLRYLMFFNVRSDKCLPKSLCKLYHLQVLDLEMKQILPKKISCLINLYRLVANANEISKIEGIGKLTALQNLLYKVSKESGHGIGQLKEMNQLRILTIQDLENVRNKEEAADAMLHQKRLSTLALTWSTESTIAAEVLDGLRPHRNLKELKIKGYSAISSPSWLKEKSLSNLDRICLMNCKSWEVLPPFGQLPFLKSLELFDMDSVKQIGHDFYGDDSSSAAFPSLQRLVFDRMCEWSEWLGVEEGRRQPFPRLSYLGIRDCYKLKGQLPLPHGLKKLDLRQSNVGLSESPDSLVLRLDGNISILAEWIPLQSLSSFESIYLSCYETTSFSNKTEEWFRHLTSLQTLEFNDCDQLESLPSHLSQLSSLEVLLINGCSNIKSLPEEGLPSSLRELTIKGYSHELYEWCKEDGPNWHKIAHITTVRFMW